MTTTTPDQPTPAQTLATEAESRSRASLAAWGAGFLTILGAVLAGVGISGLPNYDDRVVTIVDALGKLASDQAVPPGRLSAQVQWLGDNATMPMAGAVLVSLGSLLIFVPLAYMYRATKARHPQLTSAVVILGAIGCAGFAIGRGASELARYSGAIGFDGGDNSQALEALTPPAYAIGQIIMLVSSFAFGFSLVLLSMNAMRAGLLTRFMGVLGVIVGATFVLPLDQQGIIRSFWLVALGFLIAGRWPNGAPPAGETGEAQPWPSGAQARSQRAAASLPLPSTPAPVPPAAGDLTPGQRRKKRKKK